MDRNSTSKDVSAGCYSPGDSPLHRLPVGAKLTLALLMFAGAALGGWRTLSVLTLVCFYGLVVAGLSLAESLANLRKLFWFLLIIGTFPVLFTPGIPLDSLAFFPITVTREGIEQGGYALFRFLLMFLISYLLLRVTSPGSLIEAAEKRIAGPGRLPGREYFIVAVLAFQLVPLLFAEAEALAASRAKAGGRGEGLLAQMRFWSQLLIDFAGHALARREYFAGRLGMRGGGDQPPQDPII